MFHFIQRMIAVRKENPVLGRGDIRWVEIGNPAVAAYVRQELDDFVLILSNLSSSVQTIKLPAEHQGTHADLLGGGALAIGEATALHPYSFLWLREQR